ncbi:AraC family transcriptional regulator [Nocardioides baekrokdamisoli]|uniref:AraC family transcriptional regulator n=1 Tax=Nocardioides baekrokdamisoli TaxID=1804624 RepID=UPI0018D53744|nr:AraC family transcriptional regulator [Nocardioides baekrokdamisoli]
MGGLIRATNIRGYDALVRELGGDPRSLRRRFGLPREDQTTDESFVPYAPMAWMLQTTADELDCPDFGLRLSAWQGLGILGPIAVVARNTETILEAFVAIGRYLHAHSPVLHLSPVGPYDPGHQQGLIAFNYSIEEPGLPYLPQTYELSLGNGMQILRMLSGPEVPHGSLAFRHAQVGPWSTYAEVLGPSVEFEQDWCGFSISEVYAATPIDNADPATLRIATQYLEASFHPGADLSAPVADLIRRLLPTGTCQADAVAHHLGLHARTLQRRLAEEGTSFAALVERERSEQAARMLANPGLQLRQIAALLGYTEQSTFNRSFRRWYRTTPRAFRASQTDIPGVRSGHA